jgi:tRNA A37 methylthiotransferase MiaB
LVFIGACVVTDAMRERCEAAIAEWMRGLPRARFIVFGCLAAFPKTLRAAFADRQRLRFIPYHDSAALDALAEARVPFETVSASRLDDLVPYQPRMGLEDCYVWIAQGCVNDCSYCSIKKAKGHVRSRQADEIETEVRGLYQRGVRTVTLLADDCGSYGADCGADLPELMARLARVGGDLAFKLYTVFPSLFLRDAARLEPLFAEHRVPYVCLPVQSAAPRVLELMNRRYDPQRVAEAVARLRDLDPAVFVYSHFIFDFPGETWEEFEQSVAFAQHFDYVLFIAYGENRSTPAAALGAKCSDAERVAKVRRLQELTERGQLAAFVVAQT